MEEKQTKETPQEPGYTPRPTWQLWAARIGLVLFICLVILQVIQMYRGFR